MQNPLISKITITEYENNRIEQKQNKNKTNKQKQKARKNRTQSKKIERTTHFS